jgi:hypothetical protein
MVVMALPVPVAVYLDGWLFDGMSTRAVLSFMVYCIGSISTLAVCTYVGGRIARYIAQLIKEPIQYLSGTFHEQEAVRQAAIARMILPYFADSITDLILEYEHTRITMGCWKGPLYVLIADNDTMMYFPNIIGPAEMRVICRLPFRPEFIDPRGIGSGWQFHGFTHNDTRAVQGLTFGPDPSAKVSVDSIDPVVGVEEKFSVPAEDVVATMPVIPNVPREHRLGALLSRRDDHFVLTAIESSGSVDVKLPDDRFDSVAASSDFAFALTTSGVLYYLPREEMRDETPCWSVCPMPCAVRKIGSVPDRLKHRLECLALLCSGTLWMLDPGYDSRPLPTFRASSKPTDLLVDDLFCSPLGYAVVRYRKFAIEIVPLEALP